MWPGKSLNSQFNGIIVTYPGGIMFPLGTKTFKFEGTEGKNFAGS